MLHYAIESQLIVCAHLNCTCSFGAAVVNPSFAPSCALRCLLLSAHALRSFPLHTNKRCHLATNTHKWNAFCEVILAALFLLSANSSCRHNERKRLRRFQLLGLLNTGGPAFDLAGMGGGFPSAAACMTTGPMTFGLDGIGGAGGKLGGGPVGGAVCGGEVMLSDATGGAGGGPCGTGGGACEGAGGKGC